MPSITSMSSTYHPAGSGHQFHTLLKDTIVSPSIDWNLSITVPTRTIVLPSLSNTPANLAAATGTQVSSKSQPTSPHSLVSAAIITSLIICIALFVVAYRWRTTHRIRARSTSNISKPAAMQIGRSTWTLDSQAGLVRTLSDEKRVDWMEKGQPPWGLGIREAMSAKVLLRNVDDGSCGIRTSSSSGMLMMSRSESDTSVSSGGKTVKQHAYNAVAVSCRPTGFQDERGMQEVVGEISTEPLGYPEQVFIHGDRIEGVERTHPRTVVAKTRDSLGGHIYI